jgi:drug/metabolite transporter (DMT)-like permease
MSMTNDPLRRRATEMLTLATLFWGLSFPVMKATGAIQQSLLRTEESWFVASSMVAVRFGTAAVITALWSARSIRRVTWLEAWQGIGLGVCAGLGMLLQVDGLAHTSASISAFLTQCGCLILPWAVAIRDRRPPSVFILACSALAAAGVAVLANMDWQQLRIGRGEFETLLSSIVFAGQILWLERPLFAPNSVRHFTLVMFACMSLISLPVAIVSMRSLNDWHLAYSSGPVLLLLGVLIACCTMIAFVLMNRWQRVVPAVEAGLIYAAEPVFASIFALFLPAFLSRSFGIDYPNEHATSRLLLGGGLITLANVLVQLRPKAALFLRSKRTRTQAVRLDQ